MSAKHIDDSAWLPGWQETGIAFGGILVDSAKLINQAHLELADPQRR